MSGKVGVVTVKTKLRLSSVSGFASLIYVIVSIFRVVTKLIIGSLFIELGTLLMLRG